MQSDDLLIEAHLATGISQLLPGEFGEAQAHFEQVGAMYDAKRHGGHRFQFGQDPASVALDYLSWIYWLRGEPARALATSDSAVAFARSLEHPFTLSFALAFAGWHRHYARDVASRASVHCRGNPALHGRRHSGLPGAWRTCSMRGRSARRGDAAGPASLQSALDVFRATGSRCFLPYWDAFHADTLSARGDHAQGMARLDHAFAEMEATHERWAEPELHRIRGLLLERRGESAAAVEACHRRALATARQRGANAWALRAATNLAACLRAQGRAAEARDALAQALSEGAPLPESADYLDALHQSQQLQSLPA